MVNERLKKQIEFMLEIDKLKNIRRQTYVLGENRKENDAEHSWHIAVLAFMLAEYANNPIDILKVMKMLLMHDIVEIDAGDTYCYDADGLSTKSEREQNAAKRIYGILPDDQSEEYYLLWQEFEAQESSEAKFAALLDRMQPLILNYSKEGISWKEHNVQKTQVEKRNINNAEASETLAILIQSIIDDAENKKMLK